MTATPRPTRGSRSGRPLMRLLDLLGRRWTLRVLWELRGGPLTFRELQAACDDVSPSSLNARLKELRDARILTLGESGYGLSEEGGALLRELAGLNAWAARWAEAEGDRQP